MKTVWVIRGNCGDYYCGCGGGHLLAITATESKAQKLRREADALHDGRKRPNGSYRRVWERVWIEPIEFDELRSYDDSI